TVASAVIIRGAATWPPATIRVGANTAAFFVHANIVEIDQVSIRPTDETKKANRPFLYWITFGSIDGDPVSTAVVSGRDIKVPDTLIGRLVLEVTAGCATQETESSSITIASDHGWKDCALNPALGVLIALRAPDRRADFII